MGSIVDAANGTASGKKPTVIFVLGMVRSFMCVFKPLLFVLHICGYCYAISSLVIVLVILEMFS